MEYLKHTKGNWEISGQSESGRYITVKSKITKRTVARVPWAAINSKDDSDHYDAKLIAAAPELLQALIESRTFMQKQGIDYYTADLYNTLDKAIKKATQ